MVRIWYEEMLHLVLTKVQLTAVSQLGMVLETDLAAIGNHSLLEKKKIQAKTSPPGGYKD